MLRQEAQIAHENNEFNPLSQVLIWIRSRKKWWPWQWVLSGYPGSSDFRNGSATEDASSFEPIGGESSSGKSLWYISAFDV